MVPDGRGAVRAVRDASGQRGDGVGWADNLEARRGSGRMPWEDTYGAALRVYTEK